MSYIEFKNRLIETDDEGYLKNPDDWNRDLALVLADKEGINLTPEHWKVLDFLRYYYNQHKRIPSQKNLANVLLNRINTAEWLSFPSGDKKKAVMIIYKIAGFPQHCG